MKFTEDQYKEARQKICHIAKSKNIDISIWYYYTYADGMSIIIKSGDEIIHSETNDDFTFEQYMKVIVMAESKI